MLAKLMAGGGNYDLTVASDFMVEILSKQGLLTQINKDSLTNLNNIGPQFLDLPFDKGNKYSFPYMWLAGIISYDSSKIPEGTIKGYKDLWKPELKNSLTVLDDERVIIGITLKKLGYSLNETSPQALQEAKIELKKLQPNIKSYDSDSPKTSLINGEAKAIFAWGAEGNLASRENPNIKYVIPEEGLFLQQDNFVISRNFPYGNPNTAAYKYIDKAILNDKAVYPPEEAVKKGEYLKDIGKSVTDLDKIWTEVK